MIFWQNDILAKQYFGKIIFWQNHTLAKWYCGKKNILAKSYLGIHAGHFPNKHTVQSKRLCKLAHERAAIWMAEEPLLIFTGKTAARTPWSKRTPQEPESCATKSDFDLLIRLRRTVRCAKGGARLGCVLSSRVPGRRDAAVHEHALKSCAAHTGFHVKTVQPSLNLRCVGHETMSVDLSIGLCCVISVIVRKCCGLRLAVPLPNKHNYPNCCTDTQYQPETKNTYRWHLFDWSFSFYIVLLCLTSNSRNAKSKTWLRAVAPLQT